MKKIITLLLSAGIFTATYAQGKYEKGNYGTIDPHASAQNDRHDRDTHDRDDRYHARNGYDHRNVSYANQRKIETDRINREFNYKIMSIQHNRYMTNRQKRLAIRDAKNERNYKIQMLNGRLSGYANNSYGNNGYGRHEGDDRR